MAYDTLTAMTVPPEAFRPDPQVGWRPVVLETFFDGTTGEVRNRYKWVWNSDGYDFTFYGAHREDDPKLMVQLSYPRVLDGNNIKPWQCDPSSFRDQLATITGEVHRRLDYWPGITDYLSWRVFRLDSTTNFYLGDDNQVSEVLRSLHERRIPGVRFKPRSGERRSVMWSGKTRDYIVYSKEAERLDLGDRAGAVEAVGVARAEARVQRCHAVRRVLQKPLELQEGVFPTVALVTTPQAVPLASAAVMGRFEELVGWTIGFAAVKHAVNLEHLVVDLGIVRAANVIGAHVLWFTLGESRLRELCGMRHRNQFSRFIQSLKAHGYDLRSMDLDLGIQLPMM